MDVLNEMLLSSSWKTASVILLLDLVLFSFVTVRTAGVNVIVHDTTARYGENATLLCQVTETKDDLTHIIWKKKTREHPAENIFFGIRPGDKTEHQNGLGNRVQFIGNFKEKNGSIQLLRMRLLDEGIYTCVFNFFPSGTFGADINVTVFVNPVVYVKGEEPVAGYLETTLASCFASNGWPAAEVIWRFGDLENFLRTETNHTVHPNGTITVVSYLLGVPIKQLNKKNIQCVVKHTLQDEFVLKYAINIHYPPESVVINPDSLTNTKEFQCEVYSNPEPTYIWTRVNKSYPYYEGNKLPVPNLTPDFNGLYICNASNKYGSALGSLYVSVHTESSSVCWSLFGSIICGLLVVAVFIFKGKFKREWIPVLRRSNDEGAQSD